MRTPLLFLLSGALIAPIHAQGQKKDATAAPPPVVRTNVDPPPIMRVVREREATWTYGSWRAQDMGTFTIASTQNASQSAFGVICGKQCVWFVNFKTQCEEGSDYPAMINSPSGSYAIQLRCYHLDARRLLTFAMDDSSLGMLGKPGEVGFAFPLDGGKFGVSRFSLSGGADAVLKAMNVIVERRNSEQEGLRDFTI